jgi:hypothetical protein
VEPVKRPLSLLWYVLASSKYAQYLSEEVPEPPPKEPSVKTVAKAFAHRRTLHKTGRLSQAPRVKTRKSHPVSY